MILLQEFLTQNRIIFVLFLTVCDDLSPPRMKKTLDGKKAGLQDAKSLKEELSKLKEKEKKMFDKVSILGSMKFEVL